jgi:YfiH family protein
MRDGVMRIERGGWVARVPAAGAEVCFLGCTLDGSPPRPPHPVARLEQVHGIDVRHATAAGSCGVGDALLTRTPGTALAVLTADCLPVVLVGAGGVAVAHAGWRGLVDGVLEATVAALGDPSTLRAVLGPAIGPCCFEVGEEVAGRFPGAVRRPPGARRPHVDLPAEARRRLHAAGLPDPAIGPPGPCTRCHQHHWPSHRGSGGGPGRLLAYVRLPASSDS